MKTTRSIDAIYRSIEPRLAFDLTVSDHRPSRAVAKIARDPSSSFHFRTKMLAVRCLSDNDSGQLCFD